MSGPTIQLTDAERDALVAFHGTWLQHWETQLRDGNKLAPLAIEHETKRLELLGIIRPRATPGRHYALPRDTGKTHAAGE